MVSLLFDDALRFQIIEKALGETAVGDEIILGRDDGLTAESVTHGVEAGDVFALVSARAGRKARVSAIDRGAVEDFSVLLILV